MTACASARSASRRMVEWGLLAGVALGGLVAVLRPVLAPLFSDDPAVIHLGDQQFLPRLQSYLELAPALRERVTDIDYVDLRFDGRIYVRTMATLFAFGKS